MKICKIISKKLTIYGFIGRENQPSLSTALRSTWTKLFLSIFLELKKSSKLNNKDNISVKADLNNSFSVKKTSLAVKVNGGQGMYIVYTGYEAFKSISRILGPRAKNPTLGSQHAVEAGYSKCMCLFVLAFYSLSLF